MELLRRSGPRVVSGVGSEDVDLPRQQHHTATRKWERLIDESKTYVSPSALRGTVKDLLGHLGTARVLRPRGSKESAQICHRREI